MGDKKPSSRGELRRRWRAMLKDGSIASLRSEGRLVVNYVLYAADWTSCEVRFSMRRAAEFLCVHPTTVRRGVSQLLDAKILVCLGKMGGPGATKYSIPERAQPVRAPDTSRAHQRAQAVRSPDTSGAQSAHEPCAVRAQVVSGLRTLCARNSVLFSGSSVTTTETSTLARPDGGAGPAAGVPSSPSEEGDSAAGLTDGGQTRQEGVA